MIIFRLCRYDNAMPKGCNGTTVKDRNERFTFAAAQADGIVDQAVAIVGADD